MRHRAIAFLGVGDAPRERCLVGRLREHQQTRVGFGEQSRQRFGAYAMLACRIVDRSETCFDALQLCRIDVETTAILAQRTAGFVQLNRGRFDERDDLA